MELLIKGARIVDSNKDFIGDIYIKKGIINKVGADLEVPSCRIIDGEGLVVLPSFIDLHCHFREPGQTYKEDIRTGSLAALRGGFTAVNLMANTKPICSSMDTVNYVFSKAKDLDLIEIHQTVSLTNNFDGEDISHIDTLTDVVKLLSDDGKGVKSSEVMLRAMIKAKEKGLTIISHAEDENLTKYSTRLSENVATNRDIQLAKFTGVHLHLAHVSTKEAMEDIIRAKEEGYKITCEVTPHHLALVGEDTYRVNPPMRAKEDIEYLINSIKRGMIDVIATDHAPHTKGDKLQGAPGISGLETAFSVCYSVLVKEGHITLGYLSRLMSKNPAQLLGLNKGLIEEGYDGDLVLVDLFKKIIVDSRNFISKGKNTPFENMEFWGEIKGTIRKGKVLFEGGN